MSYADCLLLVSCELVFEWKSVRFLDLATSFYVDKFGAVALQLGIVVLF